MAERKPIVLDEINGAHEPLPAGDRLPLPPVSSEAGNTIEVKDDGLYSAGGGGGTLPQFRNTNSINWDNTSSQINGYVTIDTEASSGLRNLIEDGENGLGVFLRTEDTTSMQLTGDATNSNKLRGTVVISPASGNALTATPQGLYATGGRGPSYTTPQLVAFGGEIGAIAINPSGDTTKTFSMLCTVDVPCSNLVFYFKTDSVTPEGTYFRFISSDGGYVPDYKIDDTAYSGRYLKGTAIGVHDMVPGTPYNITFELVIPEAAFKQEGPYLSSGHFVGLTAYNSTDDDLGVTLREHYYSFNLGFELVAPPATFP